MNMEFALKSLREKYIKLSNEKTDGYKRNKVPKKQSCHLKIMFTMDHYNRIIQFSRDEIALEKRALEKARFKKGFVGTTNHVLTARKLLIARLRLQGAKQAKARSKSKHPDDKMSRSTTNGQITAQHFEVDTALRTAPSNDYCYVLIIQDDVKIMDTRPSKPNPKGKAVFPGVMVFNHQTYNFCLKMSLYKLRLVKHPSVLSRTENIRRLWNGVEIPQFELVGNTTVNLVNINDINQNGVNFCSATLHIQFRVTVGTDERPMHAPLALGRMLNNTFMHDARLAVLQNTDLKLYKTAEDLKDDKFEFIISLFRCDTCEIDSMTNEILKLVTATNNEILLYFPNKTALMSWQNAFNVAIVAAKKWRRALYSEIYNNKPGDALAMHVQGNIFI